MPPIRRSSLFSSSALAVLLTMASAAGAATFQITATTNNSLCGNSGSNNNAGTPVNYNTSASQCTSGGAVSEVNVFRVSDSGLDAVTVAAPNSGAINFNIDAIAGADDFTDGDDGFQRGFVRYEVDFVVSATSQESWEIDVAQNVLGLFGLKGDGGATAVGTQNNGSGDITAISVDIDGTGYNFTPSPTIYSNNPSNNSQASQQFSGSRNDSTVVSGQGNGGFTMTVAFDIDAFSHGGCTGFICSSASGGEEAAVLMGISDPSGNMDADNYGTWGRSVGPDGYNSTFTIRVFECGNGNLESGEQCDEGQDNGDPTSCCTSTCTFRTGGQICRADTGECDLPETCSGSSGSCPADSFEPTTTTCTDSNTADCFEARCNGSGACNQSGAFELSTYTCRNSAGLCDITETCTGSSGVCPTDAFLSGGTQCRAAANECDVAEQCSGSSAFCPADGFVPTGTQCTDNDATDCFDAECNGAGSCIQNLGVESDSYVCRGSAGACDPAETCDGATGVCPSNSLSSSGTVCRGSVGECDVQEVCDGTTATCPADSFIAAGTQCADLSPADCNDAQCDGAGACNQQESFEDTNYTCRATAGPCDIPELCTGTSGACPDDSLQNASTVCRPSVGECDVAETCDGFVAACPANTFIPAGTQCTDSNTNDCNDAQCNGGGVCNQVQAFESASYECRGSVGACDVAETCSGASGACPVDTLVSAGTICRGSVGECDVAEQCNGTVGTCPADVFVPVDTDCTDLSPNDCNNAQCDGAGTCNQGLNPEADTYTCRAAAGECDSAETCNGVATTCPADAFKPTTASCTDTNTGDCFDALCDGSGACDQTAGVEAATFVCRPNAGLCDVAELCDGIGTSCPTDNFLDDSTECRASAGECDLADFCTGSAATCPVDAHKTAGTQCTDGNPNDCFDAQCDGDGACVQDQGVESGSYICRASTGECDPEELCNGATGSCPSDAFEPASTACTDINTNDCFDAQCDGAGACSQIFGIETAAHTCRVAVDICDAAETCNGIVGTCPVDGFLPNTTACRAVADPQCDLVEFCTGLGVACPTDTFVNDGAACNDINGCTALDTCQGGVCTGGSPQSCSDGIVCTDDICTSTGDTTFTCDNSQVSNGTCLIAGQCYFDDNDNPDNECQECDAGTNQSDWTNKGENALCALTFGFCDGHGTCGEPTPVCPDTPRDGCQIADPKRSRIVLRDKPADKDKLDSMVYKLSRIDADFNDLGDPANTTTYALCIYDSRAFDPNEPNEPLLVKQMTVPPGGLCHKEGARRTSACWKSITNRKFLYRDQRKPPPNDGIRKVLLNSSSKPGKARFLFQAKGEEMDPPPLPLEGEVVIQVVNSRTEQTGLCWESQFRPPFQKADGSAFIDSNSD